MSTRSRIGVLLEDGSVRSVYHHWDSYPDALGAKLAKEYETIDKVEDLISGGDISTVMARSNWDGVSSDGEFVLYYSDRGDKDTDSITANDKYEFFQQTRNCSGEYAYLFNPFTLKWECYDLGGGEYVSLYQIAVEV
jgi:hypothetical protein